MTTILGIDPGLAGAAAITDEGGVVDVIDLPTVGEVKDRSIDVLWLSGWIKRRRIDFAVIENVWSMPREGVSSAFRFGRGCGEIRATVILCGLPIRYVVPGMWKRAHGLLKSWDEQSRLRAMELLPSAHQWLARKKDHHRACALLIAEWARRDASHTPSLPNLHPSTPSSAPLGQML